MGLESGHEEHFTEIVQKYRDEILKLLSCLSTYIIEGKLKLLETYP